MTLNLAREFITYDIIFLLMNLDSKIEAILFWKSEPISIKKLSEILKVSPAQIEESAKILDNKLKDRGLDLLWHDNQLELRTNSSSSEIIKNLSREELSKDLGKAGLETLAIILYKGPVKKSEIDYIRGVNSQFILRNMLVRGLIKRQVDPKDARSFVYKASFDLLSHLGIKTLRDLPEFENIKNQLENFVTQTNDAKDNVNLS